MEANLKLFPIKQKEEKNLSSNFTLQKSFVILLKLMKIKPN